MMWMVSLSVWLISEEEVSGDDIIRKFQLGFALPKRTALAEGLRRLAIIRNIWVDTGLCFKVDKDEAGNKSVG